MLMSWLLLTRRLSGSSEPWRCGGCVICTWRGVLNSGQWRSTVTLRVAGHARRQPLDAQRDVAGEAVVPPREHGERLVAALEDRGAVGLIVLGGDGRQVEVVLVARDAHVVGVARAGHGVAAPAGDQ